MRAVLLVALLALHALSNLVVVVHARKVMPQAANQGVQARKWVASGQTNYYQLVDKPKGLMASLVAAAAARGRSRLSCCRLQAPCGSPQLLPLSAPPPSCSS